MGSMNFTMKDGFHLNLRIYHKVRQNAITYYQRTKFSLFRKY